MMIWNFLQEIKIMTENLLMVIGKNLVNIQVEYQWMVIMVVVVVIVVGYLQV
jgi:hypothetical protein